MCSCDNSDGCARGRDGHVGGGRGGEGATVDVGAARVSNEERAESFGTVR